MAQGNPFPELGAAAGDIFSYFGTQAKAGADLAEAAQYVEAAKFAEQNEQFTRASTAIKEAQLGRELTQVQGATTAAVAGAGFATSGSALDILRSNAQQGALQQAVAAQQGLITEAGYEEQAQSYERMAEVANDAAHAEGIAGIGELVGAGLNIAGAFIPK